MSCRTLQLPLPWANCSRPSMPSSCSVSKPSVTKQGAQTNGRLTPASIMPQLIRRGWPDPSLLPETGLEADLPFPGWPSHQVCQLLRRLAGLPLIRVSRPHIALRYPMKAQHEMIRFVDTICNFTIRYYMSIYINGLLLEIF